MNLEEAHEAKHRASQINGNRFDNIGYMVMHERLLAEADAVIRSHNVEEANKIPEETLRESYLGFCDCIGLTSDTHTCFSRMHRAFINENGRVIDGQEHHFMLVHIFTFMGSSDSGYPFMIPETDDLLFLREWMYPRWVKRNFKPITKKVGVYGDQDMFNAILGHFEPFEENPEKWRTKLGLASECYREIAGLVKQRHWRAN